MVDIYRPVMGFCGPDQLWRISSLPVCLHHCRTRITEFDGLIISENAYAEQQAEPSMFFFAPSGISSPARVRFAAVGVSIVVLTIAGVLGTSLTSPNTAASPAYYSTQIGERWFVWLESDLTVTLNTASQIAVDSVRSQRRVHLLAGEAVFRARRMSQGLHVTVGDLEINALDATFDVRRREIVTEITTINGQIMLRCTCFDATAPSIALTTGEQLQIDPGHFQRRVLTPQDREHLAAWEEGHLVFQGEALDDAVAELNRYNRRQLRIDDKSIHRLTIAGVFSTGDVDSFIATLHDTLGLRAEPSDQHQPDRNIIRLVREVQ
jgi:transmembrane sensor